MTARIKESESLETALRRLAVEYFDKALDALEERDGRDAAIHTVRKQCKQLRALLRLYRHAMDGDWAGELRFLRDLGRGLSAARDGAVALDVHAALIARFGNKLYASVGAEVRQLLIAELQFSASRAGSGPDRGFGPGRPGFDRPGSDRPGPDNAALRASLSAARVRCRRWHVDGRVEGMLERGVLRSYRQARRASLQAARTQSAEDLHELRKLAKSFWYQLEFVARRWPDFALERTAPVRKLTELLGDNQDLVTYRAAIRRAAAEHSPEAVEILDALAENRRRAVAAEAIELAQRVFADRPKQVKAELAKRDDLRRATG